MFPQIRMPCLQEHGLRGSKPTNRIPVEQQRAVVDFALAHTTIHRERMSLQLHTRSVMHDLWDCRLCRAM